MSHDDDFLDASVPEPLDEASPSERTHARTFADLVDKSLVGRAPAAMSAEDRALLEVATVIRATRGKAELAPARARSIVEDVLRGAVGAAAAAPAQVRSIATARSRRVAPWAVAGASTLVAAAAVLALWLRGPSTVEVVEVEAEADIPTSWTSRPADPLIGPIARAQAGDASARIDYMFADRLDGYRERRLTVAGRAAGGQGGTR